MQALVQSLYLRTMRESLIFTTVFLLAVILCGCKDEPKRLETVKASKYDEFVRNPITASGDVDSSEVAIIDFEESFYDFGEVDEGQIVEHVFAFKNTGKSPLLISEARSTCGCTVPEWPEEPISPDESAEIRVVFNTDNRAGFQDKPITIYANTLPGKTVIRIKGNVKEK